MGLRQLWGGHSTHSTTIFECRACGKTIDDEAEETCPTCGSREIARYTIES